MKIRLLVAAVVIVSAVVSFIYFAAVLQRKAAGRLISDLENAEIGKTHQSDWRKLLEKRASHSITRCVQEECSFEVRNSPLHWLHLAPITVISGAVRFNNGIASEARLWVEVGDAPDASGNMYAGTGVTVDEKSQSQSCNKNYSSSIKPNGQHSWGIVTMDSCALPAERANAFAINTACLTRIGGCRSVSEILPAVFGNPDAGRHPYE